MGRSIIINIAINIVTNVAIIGLLAVVPGVGAKEAQAQPAAPAHRLGLPGFVVLVGAADSTAGYRWQAGPGADERTLVWPEGVLTVPVDLILEDFGPHDVGVPCNGELAGGGHGGRLVFDPGTFAVDEPLRLSDGVIDLYLAGGELEILPERLRYRRPADRQRDPRASYILLAGMLLLVVVLMRRARRGMKQVRQS